MRALPLAWLALQRATSHRRVLLLESEPLLLLLEPRGVVALPGDAASTVELENPAGDVVEEVAIVGDGDDRSGVLLEKTLEPRDGLGVQVIGRLVEQQQIGLLEQNSTQRHAAPLATRERRHVGVTRRHAQRVHGDLDGAVQLPEIRRIDPILQRRLLLEQRVHLVVIERLREASAHLLEAPQQLALRSNSLLDVPEHVQGRVEGGLLGQMPDANAGGRAGLAHEVFVEAGHDVQQAALSRAVESEHTDLGAGEEGQRNALENHAAGRDHLPEVLHRIDEFVCQQTPSRRRPATRTGCPTPPAQVGPGAPSG